MTKKDTTINDLAVMINKSFEETNKIMVSGFSGVNNRLDKVEGRLMKVEIRMDNLEGEVSEIRKHQAMHTIFRDEFEKLDSRVKTLEKLLIKHSS